MTTSDEQRRSSFNRILVTIDEIIYGIIAVFLIATAILTFFSVGESILHFFRDTDARHAVVVILDKLMLTLMVLEILYTVRISIQSHSLSPEPFLVVGILAAIRRILVISVESGYLITVGQEGFLELLIEIAVLGVLVVMFVWAIILLKRNRLDKEPLA